MRESAESSLIVTDTLVEHAEKQSRRFHPAWLVALLALVVALLALVMGYPAQRGGFVGGDDHRLALDHVFVNHPSFEHAMKLFTIEHRDLYQPLPLLTFQLEFAVANLLAGGEASERQAAAVIHLDNIILHAINAVLVWFLIAGLSARGRAGSNANRFHLWAATVAAALFAVHPLQIEVIAWLNGRMMLLSTLFALGSMLSLMAYANKPRALTFGLTLLFVTLCGFSKVRISLPVLLLLVCLATRITLDRRIMTLGVLCGVITGVFVLINIQSTSEAQLFSQGAEHLRGPRLVRVVFALAFYFQHLVWPVGLCSYYPTPSVVTWHEPGLGVAVLVVAASVGVLVWISRRTRVGLFGAIWFFAAIAVTLPIFPARNILAADRYMYLPIIGLLWMIGTSIVTIYQRYVATKPIWLRRVVVIAPTVLLVPLMIGMGWHVAGFYNDPISKTLRIATLFPDTPRVWEPLGWSYLSVGQVEKAAECARMELRHTQAPKVMCGGYQLLGMAMLRGGDVEEGLKILHQAIETDAKNPRAKYRLAKALVELDRFTEAVPYFEAAAALTPLHNPTLNRLADAYHRIGRRSEAREVYAHSLENSKGYDVSAIMGLSALDIESDLPDRLADAATRLGDLLEWMPENLDARTNLGVVLQHLGRSADAMAAYGDVLQRAPDHLTALLNLAQLYHSRGAWKEADPLFERARRSAALTIDQAKAIHDFYVATDRAARASTMWSQLALRFPKSREVHAFRTWAVVLAGDGFQFESELRVQDATAGYYALAVAARAYSDFIVRKYVAAMELVKILEGEAAEVVDARSRLLGALQRYDEVESGIAWTYALAAQLLLYDADKEGAELFTDLCDQYCKETTCKGVVSDLRKRLSSEP